MIKFTNILEAAFDFIEHRFVLAALDRIHREQRRSMRKSEARGGALKIDWE